MSKEARRTSSRGQKIFLLLLFVFLAAGLVSLAQRDSWGLTGYGQVVAIACAAVAVTAVLIAIAVAVENSAEKREKEQEELLEQHAQEKEELLERVRRLEEKR